MKIAILGAGAMGCLIGGLLKRSGEDVYLIRRQPDWVDAINKNGLIISEAGQADLRVTIPATGDPQSIGIVDLMVILTKTPDTRDALRNSLSLIGPRTMVLTLQNGIGNAETIAELVDPNNIILGPTTIGSVSGEPGHVTARPPVAASVTSIKKWQGENTEMVQRIAAMFTKAGMKMEAVEDIDYLLWKKLTMYGSVAALVGITRLNQDDLLAVTEGTELIRETMREIVEIANKKGIPLNFEEEFERDISVFKSAGHRMPSLGYDVIGGRKTEIDYANGAIVAEAAKLGIKAPYNRMLTNLIRIIEKTYDKRVK